MTTLVRPIKIDAAFDDPASIRAMVENHGPYPSIASYLPASATKTSGDSELDQETSMPWFRGNWAVNGQPAFAGVEEILFNSRFAEAAGQLFDTTDVIPTTVVVNVNAPMRSGAIHIDIPSFRGANRDRYPLRLLQAMGTSGLFEQWRVVEAGAVWWSYDGAGGAYDYWPDGLAGAMCSQQQPFDNVALVADNDRMFHRIGWVGDPLAMPPPIPATAAIEHVGGGWTIAESGRQLLTYPDAQIRISVLWKAQVHRGSPSVDVDDTLTADRVVERLVADLDARGIDARPTASPLTDIAWIDRLHEIYYPPIVIGDSS